MELKDFLAALARRWYLLLFAITFTAIATFLVAAKVGPTYEAEGSALIFPPVTTVQRGAESVTQGNPYLALDGMVQARDIVIRQLTSKTVVDDFEKEYPGTTYEVTPDATNSAPIIVVTVDGKSAEAAVSGMSSLVDRIPRTLSDLQAGLGLDSDSEITSRSLTTQPEPDLLHKDQIRAAVVAGAATLGAGLLAIGLADGLLAGGRAKRRPVKMGELKVSGDEHEKEVPKTTARRRYAADAETLEYARASGGGSSRLRPRSTPTTVAVFPPNGSRPKAKDLNDRGSRFGSGHTADTTQSG